jgi:GNAT superfamily N-acetyltransferase
MEIKVISYRSEHRKIFKQLNLEWLSHYHLTESHDLKIFAVTENYRRKGISRLLIEKCLDKAREIGAAKITLYSNHQLETAISLYKKYGFLHVELVNSPLETADVRMELIL